MAFKNKIYLVILACVGQLPFFGPVSSDSLRVGDAISGQEIVLPASVLENDRLILVSFLPVIVEGDVVGAIAEYDDTTTERPTDYVELFDIEGDLLAVSWFDRFGIERVAVDRGLLEPNQGELEGVFVLIVEGDLV